MTALFDKIKQIILHDGPISVAQYMDICLTDPDGGYYTTQNANRPSPFGKKGDFTTAPEISQLFGEMIGIYVAQKWIEFGSPQSFHLIEVGPGRGALMADLLRATKHIPGFHAATSLILVEISAPLRMEQQNNIKPYIQASEITWLENISQIHEAVDSGPAFLIGNEFLDALPIHQYYIDHAKKWHERCVDYCATKNELQFTIRPLNKPPSTPYNSWAEQEFANHHSPNSMLQITKDSTAPNKPSGSSELSVSRLFFEHSPAQYNTLQNIADLLREQSGFALFIDYGYAKMALGDSLQAMMKHSYTSPLSQPGQADLTSHVNFEIITDIAQQNFTNPIETITQSRFLNDLGISQRTHILAQQNPQHKEKLLRDMGRLTHADKMGHLFKIGGFMKTPAPYITHNKFGKKNAQQSDEKPTIKHGFFTRQGGVSPQPYQSLNCAYSSKDERSNIIQNITSVKQSLGIKNIVQLKQIHSSTCLTITSQHDAQQMIDDRPEGDAIVTNIHDIALGILTADCTPLLFCAASSQNNGNNQAPIIGAAHAGWGGAFNGVIENTITAMQSLGASIHDIEVAIGPCIAQDSYEVGAEFYDRFIQQRADNAKFFIKKDASSPSWHFDLTGYIIARLERAGIMHIHHIDQDTYTNEDLFFSYRRATHRQESDYGRQISCIAIMP